MRRKPVIISVVLLIMMLTIASCSIYVYNKELRAVPDWLTGSWQGLNTSLVISRDDIRGVISFDSVSVASDLRANGRIIKEDGAPELNTYFLEIGYGAGRSKIWMFTRIDADTVEIIYYGDKVIVSTPRELTRIH